MSTVGVFFGKFAPLHTGHVQAILSAAQVVDELHVIMCWDEKFQSTLNPRMKRVLTRSNRFKWLKSTFAHISNITVSFVDETPVPAYPDGYMEFANLIRNAVPSTITHFFSSENVYTEFFEQTFPGVPHICIDQDRTLRPVSATFIRNGSTEEIWQYLPQAVREDFALRVAVIGIESVGKSTATAMLAQMFETNFVEEVGRTLCEQEMFSSEFAMNEQDYIRIAIAHRHKENTFAKTANKVLLCDTNNFITYYSAKEMGIDSNILKELSIKEHYDLILFLDDSVPWVYDPLRRKGHADIRKADAERLHKEFNAVRRLRAYDYKLWHVTGSEYESRLKSCKEAIERCLQTKSYNLD